MISKYTMDEIEKVKKMIEEKKFLLLTGGVGVGKTFYANEIASTIVKRKGMEECEEQIELFSFGAHYCYENFIYGLNVSSKAGELEFRESKQRFLGLCEKAEKYPERNYVAILDDINRADISQTLGEMLSALESKDVGNVMRAGNEKISIPENLFIIATANPLIGKEKLDYAWMRRFLHYNILADEQHFGFDWAGADVGDGYKETMDKAWDTAHKYHESLKDCNSQIDYDNDGKINAVGVAFLRYYQWDIYMHVKIMYDRYYIEPSDHNKCAQYMPGHGLFLTYNEKCSYGENLVLFNKMLLHVVVPLLERQLEDGVLEEGARLDVAAIAHISGAGIDKSINEINNRNRVSKDSKDKDVVNFLNYMRKKMSWSEWYFFLGCNLDLRRIDRRTVPQISKVPIGKGTKVSWLLERERYSGEVYSNYTKSNKLPCHHREHYYMVDEYKVHMAQQVTGGREYYTFSSHSGKNYEKLSSWEQILTILKESSLRVKERQRCMKESSLKNKSKNNYIEIMDKLNIRQMILQGPPGTSKTYGAKYDIIGPAICDKFVEQDTNKQRDVLKEHMITDYVHWEKNCGWDMIQFHPSYGYEDFVRGIAVSTKENNVVYETVNKILGNMCKLAEKKEESKFFLIIDEINRADIATVFGELIYALECRGEEVLIPYKVDESYKLRIPKNLYIIGTMNTADKSIGSIDYAIRRRFLFFDCLPDESVIKDYVSDPEVRGTALNMMKYINHFIDETIDKNYNAKDLYIGHTYFLVENEEALELRLQYQILPILREYCENGVINADAGDVNKYAELRKALKAEFGDIYNKLKDEANNAERS